MSSIPITLVSHDYTVDLNKDNLIALFPQSLLAVTLELNPSADVIPITNPIVTPDR